MKIKLSATFEGKCDLCGGEAKVFSLGDEDTKRVVTICEGCCKRLGEMQASEVIEKYGQKDEKPFEMGIRVEKNTAR